MKKPEGLYAAIHAKRKRIAEGSGEKMRKPGTKGAPTAAAFKAAAKTAKPMKAKK
jgi:cysteine sulfinate desulfinase/cysteine desulfurase-like protein